MNFEQRWPGDLSGDAIVSRRVMFNLHGYLVHDAGYFHALSNDPNEDYERRAWARTMSRRNVWLATQIALECGLPTMVVGPELWARRI